MNPTLLILIGGVLRFHGELRSVGAADAVCSKMRRVL
jgi:hypothetical protein